MFGFCACTNIKQVPGYKETDPDVQFVDNYPDNLVSVPAIIRMQLVVTCTAVIDCQFIRLKHPVAMVFSCYGINIYCSSLQQKGEVILYILLQTSHEFFKAIIRVPNRYCEQISG